MLVSMRELLGLSPSAIASGAVEPTWAQMVARQPAGLQQRQCGSAQGGTSTCSDSTYACGGVMATAANALQGGGDGTTRAGGAVAAGHSHPTQVGSARIHGAVGGSAHVAHSAERCNGCGGGSACGAGYGGSYGAFGGGHMDMHGVNSAGGDGASCDDDGGRGPSAGTAGGTGGETRATGGSGTGARSYSYLARGVGRGVHVAGGGRDGGCDPDGYVATHGDSARGATGAGAIVDGAATVEGRPGLHSQWDGSDVYVAGPRGVDGRDSAADGAWKSGGCDSYCAHVGSHRGAASGHNGSNGDEVWGAAGRCAAGAHGSQEASTVTAGMSVIELPAGLRLVILDEPPQGGRALDGALLGGMQGGAMSDALYSAIFGVRPSPDGSEAAYCYSSSSSHPLAPGYPSSSDYFLGPPQHVLQHRGPMGFRRWVEYAKVQTWPERNRRGSRTTTQMA